MVPRRRQNARNEYDALKAAFGHGGLNLTAYTHKFPKGVLANTDIQTAFIISLSGYRSREASGLPCPAWKENDVRCNRDVSQDPQILPEDVLGLARIAGVAAKGEREYWNTPFAEKYFIRERSIYWTRQYSKECVRCVRAAYSADKVRVRKTYQAFTGLKKPNYVERMKRGQARGSRFHPDVIPSAPG